MVNSPHDDDDDDDECERPGDGERLALETAAFQVGQTLNSLPTLDIIAVVINIVIIIYL